MESVRAARADSSYFGMVIARESAPRRKELLQTLLPLAQRNAKPSASAKAVFDFSTRFADVLDAWDFDPRELDGIGARQFSALVNSWRREADARDMALIRAAF